MSHFNNMKVSHLNVQDTRKINEIKMLQYNRENMEMERKNSKIYYYLPMVGRTIVNLLQYV